MKPSIKTDIYLSHPVVLLIKLLKTLSIISYQLPADLSKKFQSKKGSKEINENVISSDNNKTLNNVVYILGDSMVKHATGHNVSDSVNVKVRSYPGVTTEDLVDYVKPIAH